ncbi:MAG: hypothetical protein AAGK66_06715, partial [Pseudomonadota bacterium]
DLQDIFGSRLEKRFDKGESLRTDAREESAATLGILESGEYYGSDLSTALADALQGLSDFSAVSVECRIWLVIRIFDHTDFISLILDNDTINLMNRIGGQISIENHALS